MTNIKRVVKVIDWLIFEKKVKSRRDLADKMSYTESSLSQILNEKVVLSERFINKLAIVDDAINLDWLLTGEGNMLKDATAFTNDGVINCSGAKEGDVNYGLDSDTKILRQEIEHLKSLLTEKDKQLLEKERLIDVLMKKW